MLAFFELKLYASGEVVFLSHLMVKIIKLLIFKLQGKVHPLNFSFRFNLRSFELNFVLLQMIVIARLSKPFFCCSKSEIFSQSWISFATKVQIFFQQVEELS